MPPAGPERTLSLRLGLLAALLAAAVFTTGLRVPLAATATLAYIVPVLLGLLAPGRAFTLLAAGAVTGLAVAGDLMSAPRVATHPMTVVLIWTTAALVLLHKRDEAERRRAEEAAHDSEARFNAFMDRSPVMAFMKDEQGRHVYVNAAFEGAVRLPRAEVLGRTDLEVFSAEVAAALQAHDAVVRTENRPIEVSERLPGPEGRLREWMVFKFPVGDARGRRYVGGIGMDLTERQESEARLAGLQTLAQLGQMAAVVAHEVRNPLAGIKGAIQIIEGRLPAGSGERQVVASILSRIDALADMTEDLLLFARPRSPRFGPVPLHALLREAAALLAANPELAGVGLELTGWDGAVNGDGEILRNSFFNLFLNAAQAMGGRGSIRVAVARSGETVAVSVRDAGPGIPGEVLGRVFEPFFTTRHRGTGLGLAIVKQSLEAHGGGVTVDCPPDGGTRVTVSLRAEGDAGRQAEPSPERNPPHGVGVLPRVL
jgi:PAS domain S-box-containing protein